MRGLLIALAACGSSATPRDEVESAPIPPPAPLEPIRGSHGGAIDVLAVTADGRAAASGDATGGLRLWPTLDGTQEPIVIGGAVAAALAIGHDGGGFAIAIADDADQVELVRVDARGHVRSRKQLGEAAQVEILGDGVLLLRPDQVIEHVAFDGTLLGRLPAAAGSSVRSLSVRDGAVLAIVATEKQTHARGLALAPLAWGEPSAALEVADDAVAVIAPDRTAIVARAKDGRIARFDLATGKQLPSCPDSKHGARLRRFNEAAMTAEPVAVIGDRTACFVDGVFSWWNDKTGASTTVPVGSMFAQPVFAAATDRIVFGLEHQLAIHSVERVEYLGYGFRDLTHVRPVPIGLMIGKGDQQPVLLDENFRERARFALPKLRVDWTDLVPIDERYIMVSSTRPSGDLWGHMYQIAIYDSVKQTMHQVLPQRARTGELAYEPATRMLVVTDGADTLLMELAQHTIGNPIGLVLPTAMKQIALVDPELSGGLVAIALKDHGGGKLTALELHGDDISGKREDGKPRTLRPRKTYELIGDVRAIDRAGRVYLVAGDAIDVRASGRSVARLAGMHTARIRPSPDAKHVVTIDNGKITLFQADGKRLWETAAWGTSDVDWLPSGVLYARFPHSLARLDLATGAIRERQCGWGFGISPLPPASSNSAPSVCDVAP